MNEPDILSAARQQLADAVSKTQPFTFEPLDISPWLAAALLQKAIRRGADELALRAAATLLRDAPDRLWRRCGGIVYEDIGLADVDAVAIVTASLGGKRFRSKIGGEWQVASFIVSRMVRAPKCRAADDLLMTCDLQEALAHTLVSSWQSTENGLDLLLARERYRRLHHLLSSGRMKVRVIPRDADNVFVHGKAGVIEHPDGRTYSFVGSVNDSASGFRHAYEILWGDDDPGAADWVRDEFEHFWTQGVDLPDAVVKHVAAMASRIEYRSIEAARDAAGSVPTDAILAERPIYKGGQILRSWQKRFVQTCVEDHKLHGKARFLLADDVGLGKTLSMAAAALVLSLLDDMPVLILAPATLIWQWQEELEDKLGIPAAVWSTQKKCWLDGERRPLTQRGDPELVAKCPWRIGIISTGLIINGDDEGERGALAKKSYGVVILDEAHKARASRGMQGRDPPKPNNLLVFLRAIARNAQNVILGTATPIQLDAVELWDLLSALNQGAPQVLGTPFEGGEWTREESIQFLTGQQPWPQNDTNRWALFRNPLPPASENAVFRDIRNDAGLESNSVLGPRFDELGPDVRGDFLQEFNTLAVQHNPIVRRVVRRTRPMLEGRGLLKRIGVISHPRADDGLSPTLFNGEGLVMSFAFTAAYEAAEAFSRLAVLKERTSDAPDDDGGECQEERYRLSCPCGRSVGHSREPTPGDHVGASAEWLDW